MRHTPESRGRRQSLVKPLDVSYVLRMALTRSAALAVVPRTLPTQELVASSIEALMNLRGIRQADLVKLTGIEQTKLSKSLKSRRPLSLEETDAIAKALRAPTPLLWLGGEEIRQRACAAVFGADDFGPDGGATEASDRASDHPVRVTDGKVLTGHFGRVEATPRAA